MPSNATSVTRPASTPARWPSCSASWRARACSSAPPTARCGCRPRRCGGWGSRRCATSSTSSGPAAASARPTARVRRATPRGATRPWAFGDTEAWSVPRTLLNAQLRRAGGDDRLPRRHRRGDRRDRAAHPRRGGAVRRHLVVDGAGRALGADEAHGARAAPADLHPFPRRRPEADHVRQARPRGRARRADRAGGRVGAGHEPAPRADARGPAPAAQPRRPSGGARRHRRRADRAPRTRRLRRRSSYPTSPATLHATVAELDRLTALRAAFTFFVLGDDPRLAAFMDGIARRCGGRVVAPTLDGLGAEVVADYLRNRR